MEQAMACRDPASRDSRSLATPGPLYPTADSTEPRKLQPPEGAGTPDRKRSALLGRGGCYACAGRPEAARARAEREPREGAARDT